VGAGEGGLTFEMMLPTPGTVFFCQQEGQFGPRLGSSQLGRLTIRTLLGPGVGTRAPGRTWPALVGRRVGADLC
jgi:hypothetical protein